MTENEAKEWIRYLGNQNLPYDRSPKSRKLACDIAIQALEEIQQYRAIGTIEEFKALKEKSVAKKPIEKVLPYSEEYGFNSEWKCPTCGAYVGYFSEGMSEPEQMEYCNECGQHIAKDWTEN